MQKAAGLVGCIVLCQLSGVLGALTTDTGSSSWYVALAKPPFNPPSWLFGVVWPLLYLLMGIALWLVWRQGAQHSQVSTALALFFAQLVLNAAWSPIFFGLHSITVALFVIVVLFGLILATIRAFYPLSRAAAWLLVPYSLWVAFATVLNASILWLNV